MVQGTVSSPPYRRTGFVRPAAGTGGIPFSVLHAADDRFRDGDAVAFSVAGVVASVKVRSVRRLPRPS